MNRNAQRHRLRAMNTETTRGSAMFANSKQLAEKSHLAKKSHRGYTAVELIVSIVVIAILIALLLPPVTRSREGSRRSQCKNNLKQIALALFNYESHYHVLPPAYTVDADGNPLHSWRTLILPYLDSNTLYSKIDLTKAWNDPANATAFNTSIPIYQCPSAILPANHTAYMAIVTSNSCLQATEPRSLSEIKDGLSKTLMVIEVDVAHSVPWMAPSDADDALLQSLFPKGKHSHTGGMHGATVDGSVRFINQNLSLDALHAIISVVGGETQEF